MLTVGFAAFEFTTLHMIEAMPSNRNPANLTPYINSKYLLMSPYLEGSKFEKISGDTGEISADWRKKGDKLQRITRTLDAFQHYVVAKSDERLLIADLRGKIRSLVQNMCSLILFRQDNASQT